MLPIVGLEAISDRSCRQALREKLASTLHGRRLRIDLTYTGRPNDLLIPAHTATLLPPESYSGSPANDHACASACCTEHSSPHARGSGFDLPRDTANPRLISSDRSHGKHALRR